MCNVLSGRHTQAIGRGECKADVDLPACRKYIHVYKALDMCLPPRLKFQDQQRGIPSSEPRGPSDPYLCPAQGENLSRALSQIAAFLWDPGMQTLLATEGHKHPMPETYKSSGHSPAPKGSRKREKMVAARLPQESASRPQCPRHQHSKQQLGLSHTRLGHPGSTWALELVSLSLQTL